MFPRDYGDVLGGVLGEVRLPVTESVESAIVAGGDIVLAEACRRSLNTNDWQTPQET